MKSIKLCVVLLVASALTSCGGGGNPSSSSSSSISISSTNVSLYAPQSIHAISTSSKRITVTLHGSRSIYIYHDDLPTTAQAQGLSIPAQTDNCIEVTLTPSSPTCTMVVTYTAGANSQPGTAPIVFHQVSSHTTQTINVSYSNASAQGESLNVPSAVYIETAGYNNGFDILHVTPHGNSELKLVSAPTISNTSPNFSSLAIDANNSTCASFAGSILPSSGCYIYVTAQSNAGNGSGQGALNIVTESTDGTLNNSYNLDVRVDVNYSGTMFSGASKLLTIGQIGADRYAIPPYGTTSTPMPSDQASAQDAPIVYYNGLLVRLAYFGAGNTNNGVVQVQSSNFNVSPYYISTNMTGADPVLAVGYNHRTRTVELFVTDASSDVIECYNLLTDADLGHINKPAGVIANMSTIGYAQTVLQRDDYLYVATSTGIYRYNISDATPTPTLIPRPTGANGVDVSFSTVYYPDGRFFLAYYDAGTSKVSMYSLTTDAWTDVTGITPAGAIKISGERGGAFLSVLDPATAEVTYYEIETTEGGITAQQVGQTDLATKFGYSTDSPIHMASGKYA